MKNFEGFLAYAKSNERACQVAAEKALKGSGYFNNDGTFKPEHLLDAAYVTTRESTLELIRQYHEWLNS